MATTADLEFMQQGAARAAALLRAVGNEHRLLVLCLLIEQGEASVGTLLEQVRLSQSALAQHLARRYPRQFVAVMSKQARAGLLFVDHG